MHTLCPCASLSQTSPVYLLLHHLPPRLSRRPPVSQPPPSDAVSYTSEEELTEANNVILYKVGSRKFQITVMDDDDLILL